MNRTNQILAGALLVQVLLAVLVLLILGRLVDWFGQ